MSLNTIGIVFISLIVLYLSYITFNRQTLTTPGLPSLLVPQQVGKQKLIQSKNGDASMHTELNRRKAIIYASSGNYHKIKETRTSKGSTNGSLEAFFLTSIVNPSIIQKICYAIFDGGNLDSDYCYILDGEDGDIVYDAGNAYTVVCPDPKICYSVFDGGNVDTDYCEILDGDDGDIVYQGGNADTLVCGV